MGYPSSGEDMFPECKVSKNTSKRKGYILIVLLKIIKAVVFCKVICINKIVLK